MADSSCTRSNSIIDKHQTRTTVSLSLNNRLRESLYATVVLSGLEALSPLNISQLERSRCFTSPGDVALVGWWTLLFWMSSSSLPGFMFSHVNTAVPFSSFRTCGPLRPAISGPRPKSRGPLKVVDKPAVVCLVCQH